MVFLVNFQLKADEIECQKRSLDISTRERCQCYGIFVFRRLSNSHSFETGEKKRHSEKKQEDLTFVRPQQQLYIILIEHHNKFTTKLHI